MIQQLILNTLMACHPKSEGVVVSSVNVQPEPEVQTDISSATSDDSTSISRRSRLYRIGTHCQRTKNPETEKAEKRRLNPKAVGLRQSTPNGLQPTSILSSEPFLRSPVRRRPSDLSYYDLRFYDQLEDDPISLCVRMCETTSYEPCVPSFELTIVKLSDGLD